MRNFTFVCCCFLVLQRIFLPSHWLVYLHQVLKLKLSAFARRFSFKRIAFVPCVSVSKDAESEIVFSRDKPPFSVPNFFTPAFFRDYCLTLPIKFANNKSLFLWRTCWNTNESVLASESWHSRIARTVFNVESSHFSPKLLIWVLSWMSFPKLSSYFGLIGLSLFFLIHWNLDWLGKPELVLTKT